MLSVVPTASTHARSQARAHREHYRSALSCPLRAEGATPTLGPQLPPHIHTSMGFSHRIQSWVDCPLLLPTPCPLLITTAAAHCPPRPSQGSQAAAVSDILIGRKMVRDSTDRTKLALRNPQKHVCKDVASNLS